MRIKTLSIGLLLFVVLAVYPVSNVSAETADVINAALPGLAGFISALEATPAAPYLIAGLGLIHVFSMIFLGGDSDSNDALTRNDLINTKKELMHKLNSIDAHISDSTSKIIIELGLLIESNQFLEDMRNDLEYFSVTYNNEMPDLLDQRKPRATRMAMEEMTNYFSRFRTYLRRFITKYIKPTRPLPTAGPSNLFFEYILRQNALYAPLNEDCTQDSYHYKIFKSYIYIAKILTESYVMVLSAYVVQYQEQLSQLNTGESDSTKQEATEVLKDFKNDMNVLIEKTTWALEHSSRDIKNCGKFKFIEGENYARLPYITTYVRFNTTFSPGTGFTQCVHISAQPVGLYNYNVYPKLNIGQKWIDGTDASSSLEVFYNPSDLERPFSHAKFGETTCGHADGISSLSSKRGSSFCPPDFWYAFHKKPTGISTQRVAADPGNVITGVRFKVRKNVIYVDIQQGKVISDLEVDPDTVHWRITPEKPSQVAKFAPFKFPKIEIANLELNQGRHLTAIQFVQIPGKNLLFRLRLNSENNALPSGGVNTKHEIKLDDRDDPAKIAAGANRLISSHPDPDFAYIKFQPTSFPKDLGRTTIPYIDTREVVTNPPSPVAGIGIYHEAATGDGGLIALKLIQPKLTKYVDFSKVEPFTKPEVAA